jgi:soluble lytic murein transglycosylase-like protein
MPPARTTKEYPGTAATPQVQGGGCSSGFILPPFAVIVISALLASLALKSPAYSLSESPPQASNISPIFTAEVQHWSESISRWAAASQLDPNLAATVMQIESCGDPRARSSSDAMGLFQVMPFHFTSTDNPFDPDTNAARGLAYLVRSLATARGDARLALAGYNGGIGVIGRAEWTWSAQTKRYVQYGAPIYQDARNRLSSSGALTEWYERYGVSLCRQAHQRLGLP